MTITKGSTGFVALFALMALAQMSSADIVVPVGLLTIDTNDIPAWLPDTLQIYAGNEVYNAMDGGAEDFVNGGCISTGIQVCIGPDSAIVQSVIVDFGTSAKATTMFNLKKVQYDTFVGYPAYPDSVAMIDTGQYALAGIAHFHNLFFQIVIYRMNDRPMRIPVLNDFLWFYVQKIKAFESGTMLRPQQARSGLAPGEEDFRVTRGHAAGDFIIFVENRQSVFIKIYTTSGREIASFVNTDPGAVGHCFYWNTRNIPSGCYTVRMLAGSHTCVKSVPFVR
jgi:hypothetical protein